MNSIVKKIDRSEWHVGMQGCSYTRDNHTTRQTCTYATMVNGDKVIIDEQQILAHYGRQRITEALIYGELSSALTGKRINYSKGSDGEYHLDGTLGQYIP